MDKVNIDQKFSLFREQWSQKIAGRINDHLIKLVKVQGEFVWHHHDEQDELFWVHKGRLTMKLRDRDVVINQGEFLVVPRKVEHKPVADEQCELIVIEPEGTINTGEKTTDKTHQPEWI
jgi:mannose-6-phosphate isomerase-like protein (cupin superfamily)